MKANGTQSARQCWAHVGIYTREKNGKREYFDSVCRRFHLPVWFISIREPLVILSKSLMKLASKSVGKKKTGWLPARCPAPASTLAEGAAGTDGTLPARPPGFPREQAGPRLEGCGVGGGMSSGKRFKKDGSTRSEGRSDTTRTRVAPLPADGSPPSNSKPVQGLCLCRPESTSNTTRAEGRGRGRH